MSSQNSTINSWTAPISGCFSYTHKLAVLFQLSSPSLKNKNNFNLNYHTDCVFAVRIPSFIHHPKGHLEYTHQNARLLLECHHQNAKCSCFCWVRWLSCIRASFYCLSEVYVDDIHISSPRRDEAFHLPSPKHG